MRFVIHVKHIGEPDESAWVETYDKPCSDPTAWARETIDRFNATLKPYEKAREVVRAERLGDSPVAHHWMKTNLVTIAQRERMYDTYKCIGCGITGKRYGLSEMVALDEEYKAKVYQHCDTAIAHLQKKQSKRT